MAPKHTQQKLSPCSDELHRLGWSASRTPAIRQHDRLPHYNSQQSSHFFQPKQRLPADPAISPANYKQLNTIYVICNYKNHVLKHRCGFVICRKCEATIVVEAHACQAHW